MRKRTFVVLFSTMIAIFSLVVLQQVLAASQIENNNGLTVEEGQSGVISASELSVTDTDGVYTVFTYTVLTAPVNGELRNNTTPLTVTDVFTQGLIDAGLLNYLHDGSETTSDSFDFNVTNGISTFITSTFQITITPVNDAPTGVADTAVVSESGTVTQVNLPLTNTVLANDIDPDSLTLTATLTSAPANASNFALNDDGTFIYTHDGGETTSDSFTYEVCDDEPLCDTAIVSITINPVNDAPTALDDTAVVDEGGVVTKVNVTQDDSLLDNDTDIDTPHANLTATLITWPQHASAITVNSDGTFSYTHDGSETTNDSFTYQVCDNDATTPLCDTGTVNININPVNDAPVANDDAASVSEGGILMGVDNAPNFDQSVLHDDTDAENATLVATVTVSPTHAVSFTFNADGTFTYIHDGSPIPLMDSFEYEACDGGSPNECDTAVVNIVITSVNDDPTAVDDNYTLDEGATLTNNVTANDFDEEGDDFFVKTPVLSPPTVGTLDLTTTGTFTYTHDGSENFNDSFRYELCQTNNPTSCTDATVTLNITSVNDAPTPGNDFMTVPRSTTSTTLNGGATSLLANDSDPENDNLTVTTTPVSGPAHGSLTLNANGTFSYTHDDSGNDPDSFTYEVCDNGSPQECSTAVVSITIGPRPITFIFLPVMLNNFPTDEPNNNACDAFPIGFNSNYTFLSNDAEDWYSFTLSSAKTVDIILENDTSQNGVATQLLVYQGSCTGIQQIGQDGTTNQNKSVQLTNLAAGTYFVRVFSSPITNTGYTLKVNTQ